MKRILLCIYYLLLNKIVVTLFTINIILFRTVTISLLFRIIKIVLLLLLTNCIDHFNNALVVLKVLTIHNLLISATYSQTIF